MRTNTKFLKPIIWGQKSIIDLSEWDPYVVWFEPYLQGDQSVWSQQWDAPGLDGCWKTGGFGPGSATHNLGETE